MVKRILEGEDICRPETLTCFWKTEKYSVVLKKNLGNVLSLADERKSSLAYERRLTRDNGTIEKK